MHVEELSMATGWSIPAGEAETFWFTQNRMTLVATAESTGGAFGLTEAVGPAGSSPPLHIHHREDESFWVLAGQLRCGDEERRHTESAVLDHLPVFRLDLLVGRGVGQRLVEQGRLDPDLAQ